MNKSYSKPTTDLQLLKLESSFMDCSVRGKMVEGGLIEVQDFKDHSFTTTEGTSSDWEIGF